MWQERFLSMTYNTLKANGYSAQLTLSSLWDGEQHTKSELLVTAA